MNFLFFFFTSSVGEPPRKRKATSLHHSQSTSHPRQRSPPYPQHSAGLSNPPRGLRRGHQRQQSDISSYTSYRRREQDSVGPPTRGVSPSHPHLPSGREAAMSGEGEKPRSGGGHTVSSLLTNEPSRGAQYSNDATRTHQAARSEGSETRSDHSLRRRAGDEREA